LPGWEESRQYNRSARLLRDAILGGSMVENGLRFDTRSWSILESKVKMY
jgi:hypothetical protein